MKRTHLIPALLWVASTLLPACSDPCKNTQCYNGGVCENGECDCPPGYSGAHCENYDPCYNVSCSNGGYCVDGQCDCPPGYAGTHCEKHLSPVAMRIDQIIVTSYPMRNQNNEGWDALYPGSFGANPELYARVEKNQSLFENTYYVSNASYTQDIHLSFADPQAFKPLSSRCDVLLYDFDPDNADDFIGGYYFFPHDFATTTPSIITLHSNSTWHQISMDLHVTWLY